MLLFLVPISLSLSYFSIEEILSTEATCHLDFVSDNILFTFPGFL